VKIRGITRPVSLPDQRALKDCFADDRYQLSLDQALLVKLPIKVHWPQIQGRREHRFFKLGSSAVKSIRNLCSTNASIENRKTIMLSPAIKNSSPGEGEE
jgi:hypothetical protein